MRLATEKGYKVYFYFVSKESPVINRARVQNRVLLGGHDVPCEKIEQRYYRSLDLLHNACQFAYQAFFFDTSKDSVQGNYELFAHFKREEGKPKWDEFKNPEVVPNWFIKYFIDKEYYRKNDKGLPVNFKKPLFLLNVPILEVKARTSPQSTFSNKP